MALTDGLGAAWRFDNSLVDASGNGRTLSGFNVSYTTSASVVAVGTHALFQGIDVGVAWGGSAATLADTSLTLCFWLYLSPFAPENREAAIGLNDVLRVYFGTASPAATTGSAGVRVGTTYVRNGTQGDLPTDVKTHFALTWDHTTGGWELWRNAASLASGTLGSQTANIAASTFEVDLGVEFAESHVPCDMMVAYTRKLSSSEIAQHYNSGSGLDFPFGNTYDGAVFVPAKCQLPPRYHTNIATVISTPPLYFIGSFAVTPRQQTHGGQGRPPNP